MNTSSWKDDFWESFEETPIHIAFLTYISYGMLVLVGHLRDFFISIGLEKIKSCTEPKLPVSSLTEVL